MLRGALRSGFIFQMARFLQACSLVFCVCASFSGVFHAQVSSNGTVVAAPSLAERGISLALKGRCREALPLLKKAEAHLTDKPLSTGR